MPPGVYVITPKGELLGRIPIPEDLCTNLAFGGPGCKTLYVTAGKTIYKVPLAVSGHVAVSADGASACHAKNQDDEATGLRSAVSQVKRLRIDFECASQTSQACAVTAARHPMSQSCSSSGIGQSSVS